MKHLKLFRHFTSRIFFTAVFLLALTAGIVNPAAAAANNGVGAVYTITNAASGNEVLAYDRSADGSLSFQGAYATNGLGSGSGLGSQGAVALSNDNHWLFAVNAGSNQISVFAVKRNGLKLMDTVDSGGILPISLTAHDEVLYVLNAGGSGNISGFRVNDLGELSPISGSTQPLSNNGTGAAPGPAEIAFGSDGSTLVVTEKATNMIDTYKVEGDTANAPVVHQSSGATPFGFAFDREDHIIVSEAFGGVPGASALSSYRVHEDEFEVISPSVGTTQTAACWVVISNNGKFAYTTNAGSGSISSYRIGQDGSLTLMDPAAGLTGASPVDMAFNNSGQYLYALAAAGHTISIFSMGADGSLTAMGSAVVPAGVAGLAAR